MDEKQHSYIEDHAYFSPLPEKVKKKSFGKRYFWQIFALCTAVFMVIFASTTVLLLIRSLGGPSNPPLYPKFASTATALPTPGPTLTPVSTLVPTPILSTPAGVLCETGSSDNWKDWQVQEPWKFLPTNHQLLLHDGSGSGTLIAPAFCQPKVPDYAVEARIKPIAGDYNTNKFGLTSRSGYAGTIDTYDREGYISTSDNSSYICQKDFAFDSGYHTYRVEARGNEISLLVDGSNICSATDNRYLSPGQVGLFSDIQVEITDFKVVLL